jgi:hypothetical protein
MLFRERMLSMQRTNRALKWVVGLAVGVLVFSVAVQKLAQAESEKARAINIGGADQPGATIQGVVKFNGKQAKRKPIRMDADKACAASHAGEPPLEERYVFGANDTLQNVFVWVSKGLEGKTFAVPSTPAVINQHGCVYEPHVLGVMVNQELSIHNGDNTLHNVKMISKNNGAFNEGMPVKDIVLAKKFTKPEMAVPLRCDVHPWMMAYVHAMAHPYFAVTQRDGTFEIRGLPAGQYELSTWHEFDKFTSKEAKQEVTLAEGETKEVIVTYSPPGQ